MEGKEKRVASMVGWGGGREWGALRPQYSYLISKPLGSWVGPWNDILGSIFGPFAISP